MDGAWGEVVLSEAADEAPEMVPSFLAVVDAASGAPHRAEIEDRGCPGGWRLAALSTGCPLNCLRPAPRVRIA